MTDIIAASIIVAIPLFGIMFILDRFSNRFLDDGFTINNRIDMKISHPSDVNVGFDSDMEQNKNE